VFPEHAPANATVIASRWLPTHNSENRPRFGGTSLIFTGHRESPVQANQRFSAPRRGLLAVKLLTYKERVEAFRVTDRPSDGDRAQADGPRR
jgi:hypothetical protein